ncbi:hypothetical protein HQ48_07040 [Porphyromonas sp. COT-290 OH3588]|nr:hypothetical protein HQ41_03025 [Porphyromonas sp. COT-290 OH860]KGO00155.1 hypothetical protein HQ48_07040 [Porphyromonas sp. COT-290 OH3588]
MKYITTMKYLGVFVLLIGALLLIWAGFNPSDNNNTILGVGILLVIGGYLTHIFMMRKSIK